MDSYLYLKKKKVRIDHDFLNFFQFKKRKTYHTFEFLVLSIEIFNELLCLSLSKIYTN